MNPLCSLPSLVGACAIFTASVISGLTGMGFALISVPILILFLPPRSVVPLILLLSGISNLLVVLKTRKWLEPGRFLPLLVTGVIGATLGTKLLVLVDTHSMTMAIGLVSVLSSLGLLLGLGRPVRREQLGLACTGLLSGMLGGSTSMSGPPVILFLANQAVEKQVLRANITLYFVVLSVSALPSQIASNLIGEHLVTYAVVLLPVLTLGTLLGIKLSAKVEEEAFRKVVLSVVTVAGVTAIASGLQVL